MNRFNFEGRSYKVIPQLKRIERLNASQLENNYVKGPDGSLVPLSTFAHLEKKTTPRSLNRFQQLNAVMISGLPLRPLDETLKFLETEAAKILPQGYSVGYTGESRQLRVEGNKFLPAFVLALVLIFLVLAAQFNSFRDPFIIILGLRAARDVWRVDLHVPEVSQPQPALLDGRLDHHVEHLFPGGAGDARGFGVQERHPHC